MFNIIAFINFLSFVFILIGVGIKYDDIRIKRVHITFFISFILVMLASLISDNIIAYCLSLILELLCTICIFILFYFLKKSNSLSSRANLVFIVFFVTQVIIILDQLLIWMIA